MICGVETILSNNPPAMIFYAMAGVFIEKKYS